MDKFRPESFLPLTPVAFEILLALAEGERHGYSILQEVDSRSGGAVSLHAGTLYRALGRMEQMGLLRSHWEDPEIPARENRPGRRLYRLTAAGESAAREAIAADAAAARRVGRRLASA